MLEELKEGQGSRSTVKDGREWWEVTSGVGRGELVQGLMHVELPWKLELE